MRIEINDSGEIAEIASFVLDSCEVPELAEDEQQELRFYMLNGCINIATRNNLTEKEEKE